MNSPLKIQFLMFLKIVSSFKKKNIKSLGKHHKNILLFVSVPLLDPLTHHLVVIESQIKSNDGRSPKQTEEKRRR